MNNKTKNLLKSLIREEISSLESLLDFTPPKEKSTSKMVKSQLFHVAKNAQSMHDRLEEMDELPEWAKSKIAIIKYALDSVYDHFDYNKHKENNEQS
jgi:chromosome condensin MukBEF complex kleisin-like MukF subunit